MTKSHKHSPVTITKLILQFIQTVIQDKIVLYITLLASILNVLVYLSLREYDAVFFFVAIGLIASYFSKNMTLILMSAIVATFFAVSIKVIGKVREGLTSSSTDSTSATDPDPKPVPPPSTPVLSASLPSFAAKKTPSDEKPPKETMQTLEPGQVNTPDDDLRESDKQDGVVAGHKPKVNYASTLESAYDNLDKLLSSDAIKNMSSDTQRLASKQQALMGNIEKLEPMMQMAGKMLEKFSSGGMMDKFASLQNMLGNAVGGNAGGSNAVVGNAGGSNAGGSK